jgi:hypothetical protein
MKLSEYIHSKMGPPLAITWRARKEEDIEQWIIDWYNESFKAIGSDGTTSKIRMPPMWLANWRKPERSVVEQERCGIDEG